MEATASYESLRKELGLRGVFAIATGTTLSAGFFLLPSFAAQQAGLTRSAWIRRTLDAAAESEVKP